MNYSIDLLSFRTKSKFVLVLGILLVLVAIGWFIALRPLIDIPVSLIGAFFIMYLLGYSVNVLTLLAIVLATGLDRWKSCGD